MLNVGRTTAKYAGWSEAREEVAAWDEDPAAERLSFDSYKDGSGVAVYQDLDTLRIVTIEWGSV